MISCHWGVRRRLPALAQRLTICVAGANYGHGLPKWQTGYSGLWLK